MQFSIKAAGMADLPELVPLFNAYRVFYEQPSDLASAERFLRARFEGEESKVFIAVNDQAKGLGFVQLYPSFSSVSMRRVWILNDLFVADYARKQGVGEALMERARQLAVETEARGLQLETGKNNLPAQSLYEKLHYVKNEDYFVYYLSTL
ncbi:MAG: GNAT family N-acetyltransferase [Bacteroidota bacterium]